MFLWRQTRVRIFFFFLVRAHEWVLFVLINESFFLCLNHLSTLFHKSLLLWYEFFIFCSNYLSALFHKNLLSWHEFCLFNYWPYIVLVFFFLYCVSIGICLIKNCFLDCISSTFWYLFGHVDCYFISRYALMRWVQINTLLTCHELIRVYTCVIYLNLWKPEQYRMFQ